MKEVACELVMVRKEGGRSFPCWDDLCLGKKGSQTGDQFVFETGITVASILRDMHYYLL